MMSFTDTWRYIIRPDGSAGATVIQGHRIPRTVLAVVIGSALGVAGALMQALTRNPLADPGILGVNAGSSLAVVVAVAVAGVASIWFYVWFAFLGAAAASVAVYVLGGLARRSSTPARLALAGVAVSMAVTSFVEFVSLSNQNVFNEFRFWAAGSLENRGYPVIGAVVGFIAVGLILAVASGPALNALALGDDHGAALGVNIRRTRSTVMLAVTLLAGAATAAAGPIMFVGLGVPYLARWVCGPDQRWVIPFSALAAPAILLTADILARVVVYPQEIQTGIVTALVGAPLFVAIVRRGQVEAL
ncbi:putative siderophore transport system permease protein YfiZ precursor [Corynebacterium auris]|nr:putative siderophore transport system permease protein YfiZ precursor [Corynebacterium auris]